MPFEPVRFPDDVPTLSEGDVTLRAHRPGDLSAVVEQCTDPLSVRWTTVPENYDEAAAAEFVGQAVPAGWRDGSGQAFALAATHRDGRRGFAGTLSLIHRDNARAELAFGAHPGVRGTGAMQTAGRLLLAHGFDTLGLQAISWWSEVGNWGSRRLAHDLGFQLVPAVVPHWLVGRDQLSGTGALADAWTGVLHRDDPIAPDRSEPRLSAGPLLLRPHRRDDDVRMAETCADPVSQHFLSMLPSPYTPAHAAEYRRGMQTGAFPGQRVWAVSRGEDGELLATLTLHDRGEQGHEIGYSTHPDARGRGVTATAVGALTDHALTPLAEGGLGVSRVLLRAAAENHGSRAVARSCGFVACGRDRGTVLLRDGTRTDHVVHERVPPTPTS